MSIKSKNKQKSQTHKTTPKEQQAPQLPEMLFFFFEPRWLNIIYSEFKSCVFIKVYLERVNCWCLWFKSKDEGSLKREHCNQSARGFSMGICTCLHLPSCPLALQHISMHASNSSMAWISAQTASYSPWPDGWGNLKYFFPKFSQTAKLPTGTWETLGQKSCSVPHRWVPRPCLLHSTIKLSLTRGYTARRCDRASGNSFKLSRTDLD